MPKRIKAVANSGGKRTATQFAAIATSQPTSQPASQPANPAMISAPFLRVIAISLLAAAVTTTVNGGVLKLEGRDTPVTMGGYVQKYSGSASFTQHAGCARPACGMNVTGFSAGISQLAYGAPPGLGVGDACGRCFEVTANADPYDLSFNGPYTTIVLKATNLCPFATNGTDVLWCSQTQENPVNKFGAEVHFDLCEDTGAPEAFFPDGHHALTGTYREVSCYEWIGTDGPPLWDGACLDGECALPWPAKGCGNQGDAPSSS